MSATPPEASTQYSRGSGASREGKTPSDRGRMGVDPGWSAALRAAVLGTALLGALLLVLSEFTTLFTVNNALTGNQIKSVGTGSHDSYALIPIALLAIVLAWGAVSTGNRWALVALGAMGIAALLIALVGDLPDARATGTIGNLGGFRPAKDTPSVGLFLETVGAIALMVGSVCGLLLGRPAPAERAPQSGS